MTDALKVIKNVGRNSLVSFETLLKRVNLLHTILIKILRKNFKREKL